MKGQVSSEVEVKAPASAVWAAYNGLHLGRLVNELLSDVLGTTQVVQGDGGVGTIIKLTFPPQASTAGGPSYMKEIFTVIDNEKRIKETELIEGGFKDMGFEIYRIRIQILEKDEHLQEKASNCIIKSTITYEVSEEHASNVSFVTTKPLEIMATVIGNHVAEQNKLNQIHTN